MFYKLAIWDIYWTNIKWDEFNFKNSKINLHWNRFEHELVYTQFSTNKNIHRYLGLIIILTSSLYITV